MKSYLLDTFAFNRQTNLDLIEKITQLTDPDEAIRHMSHLVNCQYKWLARINQDPQAPDMSWWEPTYTIAELPQQWAASTDLWIAYLGGQSEEALAQELTYTGYDGGRWAARPLDIALQLSYHAIHHRAQIQLFIRQQGLDPEFVDYIGTRQRKVS